jgi:hypothetical protein
LTVVPKTKEKKLFGGLAGPTQKKKNSGKFPKKKKKKKNRNKTLDRYITRPS